MNKILNKKQIERVKNLTGKKFGKLTILEFNNNEGNAIYFICQCDCNHNNTKIVSEFNLKNKRVQSCGCLRQENIIKHGFSKKGKIKSFYIIWSGMKQRCNNKNNFGYKWYGGEGKTYDIKWETFEGFYDDMYWPYLYAKWKYRKILKKSNPLSLERKDASGNYTKQNCCFIPKNEQAKNTRHLKWFKATSPEGKEYISKNQSEFAKEHNLFRQCINDCLLGRNKTHKEWRFEYINEK